MKKALAILLALTLALGLCGPALAQEEVVTLKVLARTSDVSAYQDFIDALNEKLEAALNVRLEWIGQASSGYPDFVNNMLLTWDPEEVYDLIYIQGTAINAAYLGSMDTLVDMTDLVASSTYLKPAMESNPILKAQFESCPYQLWPSSVNMCLQFRTDVLEACPSYAAFLEKPDQAAYTQLLSEIKAQGYEGALTTQGIAYLFNTGTDAGFGITNTWMKQDDGSCLYSRVSDNFLDELKWWRQLYVDGVLHANFATDNWESMENALYTGKVAGIAMKGGAYTVYYDSNTVANYGEGAHITILPPMVSDAGEQQYKITSTRFDRGWCISSSSKHVDKAFAVLDYMMSDEGRKIDLFGLEGVDYTLNEDGTYNLLHNSSEMNIYRIFDADVFGNVDVQAVTTGAPFWPDASFQSLAMVKEYGRADNDFVIPDEYATAWTACESLWQEFATQYILGEKTDADWQTFVDTWNSYGGADVAQYAATILN